MTDKAALHDQHNPGTPKGLEEGLSSADKIMDAATALFAQHPFSAVSVKEIAQASGVNSALISYYYGGKKKLYQSVLLKQSEAFTRIMDELGQEDLSPSDKLQRYVSALAQLQEEQPHCLYLIYRELISPQPTFANFVKNRLYRIHTFMTQLVAEAMAQEELGAGIQPTHVAFTVEGIIMFYFLMKKYIAELGNFPPGEETQYLQTALGSYLASLQPKGRRP